MTDVVVIGGGIAGVAAAAFTSDSASVTLLEAESTLAFHTTGRSAAVYVENYGSEGIRPLSIASKPFLDNPPEGVVDAPLLTERAFLWVSGPDDHDLLEDHVGPHSQLITAPEARSIVPVLDESWVTGGVLETTSADIDVAGLHQAFVRMARANGTEISASQPVLTIERRGQGWRVQTPTTTHDCDVVVNAAGAWGDDVAGLAGIPPVGLTPMRRTAFMVPGMRDAADWPLIAEAKQEFYIKSDGEQFLCSLAEEVPSAPTDPRARMEDVALAIDRINRATTLNIRTVNSEWVGLRTFAPDREMVIGEEPAAPGFFWLVGQGGTGIQTAAAYGQLIAGLIRGGVAELEDIEPQIYSPKRFRN